LKLVSEILDKSDVLNGVQFSMITDKPKAFE